MMRIFLVALVLLATLLTSIALAPAIGAVPTIKTGGVCSSQCQQARYHIQILQDRIWRERQKGDWANWDLIGYWQDQIRRLSQVR